jgi:hypothetical protein
MVLDIHKFDEHKRQAEQAQQAQQGANAGTTSRTTSRTTSTGAATTGAAANTAAADILWILEQIPGRTEQADVTSILLANGYWPSYNVPYFDSIYKCV